MNNSRPFHCTISSAYRQHGLSLLVALIALAAMSMAGVALIRSIDTNALIAGNLAFRQNSTTSAETGVEAARQWLMNSSPTSLYNSQTDSGYYAIRDDTMDITGSRTKATSDNIKWVDASDNTEAGSHTPFCQADKDATGNRVCYVINRMCTATGDLDSADCSVSSSSTSEGISEGAAEREGSYQTPHKGTGSTMGRYRITVRVSGPRNNNSYVQVFIQR
jgi:Tfp pilus assembly protein PilX